MADDRKGCLDDALKNLSESHKTMHTSFLTDLALAEGMGDDPDARHQHIQRTKEHLLNGYQVAEDAYKAEVETCKQIHAT